MRFKTDASEFLEELFPEEEPEKAEGVEAEGGDSPVDPLSGLPGPLAGTRRKKPSAPQKGKPTFNSSPSSKRKKMRKSGSRKPSKKPRQDQSDEVVLNAIEDSDEENAPEEEPGDLTQAISPKSGRMLKSCHSIRGRAMIPPP